MIGIEATVDRHRPLANYLIRKGFELKLVSSVAVTMTREATYKSCGLTYREIRYHIIILIPTTISLPRPRGLSFPIV